MVGARRGASKRKKALGTGCLICFALTVRLEGITTNTLKKTGLPQPSGMSSVALLGWFRRRQPELARLDSPAPAASSCLVETILAVFVSLWSLGGVPPVLSERKNDKI